MGSFVSKNVIPQMVDTEEVIKGINVTNSNSKLLTIVANERGALYDAGNGTMSVVSRVKKRVVTYLNML